MKITEKGMLLVISGPSGCGKSTIVSNILAFTSNFRKAFIKGENVEIVPDFVSGKGRLEADITLSAPVHSLLFSLVRGYLKGTSRK